MNGKKGNEYKLTEDRAIIYLRRRSGEILETYIDLDDFDRVINFPYTWRTDYKPCVHNYYCQSTIYLGKVEGKIKNNTIYLHRFIMDERKRVVDHINHNTLDNRKSNLRVAETNKNLKNRSSKNSNNKSGYRNVSWNSYYNKWVVQLQVEGKNTILGYFDDVHDAGKFAEEMRLKHYGEYKGNS